MSDAKRESVDPADSAGASRSNRSWWRPVLLIGVIVAVIVLARVFGLGERLASLREWIESLGAWGPLAFLLLYIAAVVLAIPGSAISIAAGALFGSVRGVILVSIGSTVGASLSFLIARYFAREATVRWAGKNEKFARLDQLTEKYGAVVVALVRLVPLFPFNLVNYGFGLTRVRFWTYVFWSWLCMLPATVVFVVGADAAAQASGREGLPWELLVAVGVALVVLILLVRYARSWLRRREGAGSAETS